MSVVCDRARRACRAQLIVELLESGYHGVHVLEYCMHVVGVRLLINYPWFVCYVVLCCGHACVFDGSKTALIRRPH